MICVSTRGKAPAVSFRHAVVAGLAPDGGLYVPKAIPRLSDAWWQQQRGRSFEDLAVAIAEEIAGDEFDRGVLEGIVRDALNFPVPIVDLGPELRVVELFHGPTFAFKDFGARTLARLLARLHDGSGAITVLVATSGDTGGAVAHAFHNVVGTRVVVLYPEGQVSDVQEAQFTTLGGNVTAVAVRGTFDDCQRLAKAAFADAALQSRARLHPNAQSPRVGGPGLTSANSISLGRLIPQTFYFAYAALHSADPPIISVPSGNFGNLAAGVIAMKLGAPIKGFSAPTTINDTFPRYLASGRVEPRPSVTTLANAMDVGNPSNLERLRWLFKDDVAAMRAVITSAAHTDADVRRAIEELCARYSYVADPHTAIAFLGTKSGVPGSLFLSTAHAAKFREVVEPVIGKPVPLPDALAATIARKKVVVRITPDLDRLRDLL